jgi:TetR/AcrR family transcriptional regulator, transcriptional repressor for nem operon
MARLDTRERIIEAGLKTLLEKGFNGCGVQEITDVAGVPKGSFYNHFDSKEALGAEIVDRYSQGSTRRVVLKDVSVAPLERLRRHFEALNEKFAASKYERGCLLGNFSAELASQSPLIRERLTALSAEWTKDIEDAVREGQADGSIATRTDAGDVAAFLLDSYEGALLRARVEKNGHAFARFMTIAFRQILM